MAIYTNMVYNLQSNVYVKDKKEKQGHMNTIGSKINFVK